ncbi:MAG TPA: hypothetical protein VJ836_01570 [Candidatus Saccharimonadales bacterium]|nr:hypothetical protein [Candidatus Saccharimonadales bacterium]
MEKKLRRGTKRLLRKWRLWPYKNTLLLVLSLILFFHLIKTPVVDDVIRQIGTLGYIGAFITGIFFVSTFTVAPAAVILFHFADNLHPVEVALLAGLGAMIGDYIIFRFMRDKVFDELRPLFLKLRKPKVKILFRSPYFAWVLPVAGAFIIAELEKQVKKLVKEVSDKPFIRREWPAEISKQLF